MIEIKNLSFSENGNFCNNLDFTVENGEVFFLLCKHGKCINTLFRMIGGLHKVETGHIFLDGIDAAESKKSKIIPAAAVDRLDRISDFETEISPMDYIHLMTHRTPAARQKVLESLLFFNLFEKNLKNKIKYTDASIFKAVYLAVLLANDYRNIIFFDFLRGEGKDFEINFNRLLREKVKEEKAILYLTQDLFYAYQVADRVNFIKNGYLMPDSPIAYEDLKEMDVMKLYQQYLG